VKISGGGLELVILVARSQGLLRGLVLSVPGNSCHYSFTNSSNPSACNIFETDIFYLIPNARQEVMLKSYPTNLHSCLVDSLVPVDPEVIASFLYVHDSGPWSNVNCKSQLSISVFSY
jgi:hypothetical protein